MNNRYGQGRQRRRHRRKECTGQLSRTILRHIQSVTAGQEGRMSAKNFLIRIDNTALENGRSCSLVREPVEPVAE